MDIFIQRHHYLKKPVVACKIGGLKEIIKNQYDGFLVDKTNYKQFALRILELIQNKKLSKVITSNSYKKVKKNFSAKNMSKEYFRTIYDIK